ncbi:RecQ family zinc-binding domain-containing protein [Exiguobacterium artemiae]
MINYIQNTFCRRAFILEHFDERPVVQDRCCDNCGTSTMDEPVVRTGFAQLDWKNRLEEVFFHPVLQCKLIVVLIF